MDSTQSETLGYDAVNRLSSVASTADNESYQYDADGNRASQTVNGVHIAFNVAPDSNQLDGWSRSSDGWTESYNYDQEGDLVSYSGGTSPPSAPPQMFYYDGFNHVIGTDVSGLFMFYNVSPEGQRLRKFTADTKTYFAPDANGPMLAEDQNGDWMDYVWLNGRVVTVISNGGVFPLHDDQTGRPLYMTDPNSGSQIDWAAQGLPFDRNVTTNRWGDFNVGFPGQYYDEEDGLWNNGARDYDASLGRYIESDPIGLAGGVNTYAYVGNNPVSNVDPHGRLWITAAIGLVTGGIAGYEAGGWKGALAGGAAGAVVGFIDPLASEAAGAAAAEWVGSAAVGTLVNAGTTVTIGAAGGFAGNVGYNMLYNSTRSGCQPARGWDQGAGYAMALGAAAPLMSGEAFAAGSGALGETGLNVFSGITGGMIDVGELGDPDARH